MFSIAWEPLPAVVAVAILVLAAMAQVGVGRVPNLLTLPMLVAGWAFAAYQNATHASPPHAMLSSLLGAALALAILVPAYARGYLGPGCIKAQMAYAAWLGAAVPLVPALALVGSVTLLGIAFTFALAYSEFLNRSATEQAAYLFPAQVTTSLVAVVGTLACWMLSSSLP